MHYYVSSIVVFQVARKLVPGRAGLLQGKVYHQLLFFKFICASRTFYVSRQ